MRLNAYRLELFKVPRTTGQVGLLQALREFPRLPLTVSRERGRILLRRSLMLLFYRCRLRAAAKKHRRDAMANSRSDGDGARGGSHLSK